MLPKDLNQLKVRYFLTGENPPKDNPADVVEVFTFMPVMFYLLMHMNLCYVRKYSNPHCLK